MQQKTCEGTKSSWQDSTRNGNVYKPFRCPQCGENSRFRSLSSLRAHLDYMHSYEERYFLGKSSIFCSLKESEPKSSIEPLNKTLIGSDNNGLKQNIPLSALCDVTNENKISSPLETLSERPLAQSLFSDDSTHIHNPGSVHASARTKLQLEPQGKVMFSQNGDNVDKTIEKKIDNLNKELCQKTSELLEVRAAFLQLSQKKQEVQRRERALSRQVDVAVELIAILRQRLTESEQELQRKEEEVVTINHFLEAAAEKEFRGKRRLQHFIENLLQRVEVAEKQLEYYQKRQIKNNPVCDGDAMIAQIHANRKSKNRCNYHPVNITNDIRPQSVQKGGRTYINRVGIQPMKLLHETSDGPRDLWKVQKKGDSAIAGRKVYNKTKLGKKPGVCNSVYKQY
uniref:Zinc finger protein 365 n=1 Tax=Leptobrachium leishanense TaxID=445787 RepID=A0A8C5M8A2_9ANUR